MNVSAPTVIEARKCARTDPHIAGALLARDIALYFESLTDRSDAQLTETALAELLRMQP